LGFLRITSSLVCDEYSIQLSLFLAINFFILIIGYILRKSKCCSPGENKKIAMGVIKNLAVYGQSVCISYVRFRQEIINVCGEDFLPQKPTKFMGSLSFDLRTSGISIEFKKAVRGILPNGERDTIPRIGFVIHCMTNGNLMTSALPN